MITEQHELWRQHDYPDSPPRRKKPRSVLMTVLIALLTIGLIVGTIAWVNRESPKKGVERYFHALELGHNGSLTDHVVNVPDLAEIERAKALLNPTRYYVGPVKMKGKIATVEYVSGGSTHTVDLAMQKVDGQWKVVDGFSTLEVRTSQPIEFTVGYATDLEVTNTAMLVFPGEYEIRSGIGREGGMPSYFWEIDAAGSRVVVKPGEHKVFEPEVRLSHSGQTAARTQVSDAFARCVASSRPDPEGCPFGMQGQTSARSGTWTVSGDNRHAVAEKATLDPGQPFNNVCLNFPAQLTYRPSGASAATAIPATRTDFTACVDMSSANPSVQWEF